MNYSGIGRSAPPPLSSPERRWRIFCHILLVHVVIIGGPLLWLWLSGKLFPPRENVFKVKLGGAEPSHAPVVGPPERLRPSSGSRAPERPRPAEPTVPAVPQKRPMEPAVKPIVKPRPRPKPRPKARPKAETPAKSRPSRNSASRKPRPSPERIRRPTSMEEAQAQVYRPSDSGGANFNRNVPLGSRDAGQARGAADNRTPQGGLTEAEEAYYARLKKHLDFKWSEPSRVQLGEARPKSTIELNIAADGRVLNARVVERSGNVFMDDSIQRLIRVLDRVPAPPGGALKIYVLMEVK